MTSARNMMIAWSPAIDNAGSIAVGPWPDRTGWSSSYDFKSGACFSYWRNASPATLRLLIFREFVTLTVNALLDPGTVDAAFRAMDEYREMAIRNHDKPAWWKGHTAQTKSRKQAQKPKSRSQARETKKRRPGKANVSQLLSPRLRGSRGAKVTRARVTG